MRRERLALWLLMTIGLCGCTRTVEVKTEEHATATLTEHATTEQRTVETVQTGPETITTTTEEYELPAGSESTAGRPAAEGQPSRPTTSSVAPAVPVTGHPILVKRTVTVDQKSPTITAITAEAKGASSAALAAVVDRKTERETKTRYGPPWWLWALLAGGLAGAGWLAWRFSLPGRVLRFLRG